MDILLYVVGRLGVVLGVFYCWACINVFGEGIGNSFFSRDGF